MTQAQILTVDFSKSADHRMHSSGNPQDDFGGEDRRPRTAEGKLLTAKQIRARARRKANRANIMSTQEQEVIFRKPIDEWDLEELSRGRPRSKDGHFRGPKPRWITREVHEQSMELFKAALKTEMNHTTVSAIDVIRATLLNDEVDDKGKPIVPASTKLDAAKFLLEHVVGKPKQVLEADVSVKLQGILATVMANPTETFLPRIDGGQGYEVGHLPGVTIPFGIEDAEVEEDEDGLG